MGKLSGKKFGKYKKGIKNEQNQVSFKDINDNFPKMKINQSIIYMIFKKIIIYELIAVNQNEIKESNILFFSFIIDVNIC